MPNAIPIDAAPTAIKEVKFCGKMERTSGACEYPNSHGFMISGGTYFYVETASNKSQV